MPTAVFAPMLNSESENFRSLENPSNRSKTSIGRIAQFRFWVIVLASG